MLAMHSTPTQGCSYHFVIVRAYDGTIRLHISRKVKTSSKWFRSIPTTQATREMSLEDFWPRRTTYL